MPKSFVVSFVLALNKAHVLALNPAHVLRLNKADVLALNKAHVLRLNNICPVFRANTKETTKGRAAEGRPPPLWRRPKAASPYGWVCGGWEGIRRGKIMPNRAGIVAAKWYFAKWYLALQVQGTF